MEPIAIQHHIDLSAIRARLSAITQGPWVRHGPDVYGPADQRPLLRGRDGSSQIRAQADADAEFIAHAPGDMAALLDAVEQHLAGERGDKTTSS